MVLFLSLLKSVKVRLGQLLSIGKDFPKPTKTKNQKCPYQAIRVFKEGGRGSIGTILYRNVSRIYHMYCNTIQLKITTHCHDKIGIDIV